MTPADEKTWSRPRWLGMVVVVFLFFLGSIRFLGQRQADTPRKPFPAPDTFLAAETTVPFADLTDPTLFSLPHAHGFSGQARALTPRVKFNSGGWDEPFRWLPLHEERLGQSFRQLLADNITHDQPAGEKFAPVVTALSITAAPPAAQASSQLRVEGSLAGRALLAAPKLSPQRAADAVPDSIVQALVDTAGNVVTATLLSHSGPPDTDALAIARQLKFEPLPGGGNSRVLRPLEGLVSGRLVFHWLTVAPEALDQNSP